MRLNKPWCHAVLIPNPSMDLSALHEGRSTLGLWLSRVAVRFWLLHRKINHAIRRSHGETWGDPS